MSCFLGLDLNKKNSHIGNQEKNLQKVLVPQVPSQEKVDSLLTNKIGPIFLMWPIFQILTQIFREN